MKKVVVVLLLFAIFLACIAGCVASDAGGLGKNIVPNSLKANAVDLMEGVSPNSVDGRVVDDAFIAAMADFSIELFKKSIAVKENDYVFGYICTPRCLSSSVLAAEQVGHLNCGFSSDDLS